VAEFLSPAWVADLDATLRTAPGLAPLAGDEPIVLELRVRRAGGVEHAHHIVCSPDGVRALDGQSPEAAIVLSTDEATATALHRGDVTAQAALASGQLRLGGDLDAVARRSDAFGALGDVFAALRATTTFPADAGAGGR
jgi:hypothetical protein